MNNKHLLVKAITLLFHESHTENNEGISNGLIKQVVATIKLPEVSMGMDIDRDVQKNLVATVQRLLNNRAPGPITKSELMQQVMIDCRDDEPTYEALVVGIEGVDTEQQRLNIIGSMGRDLTQYLRNAEARRIVKEFSGRLIFDHETIEDLPRELLQFTNDLEPFYSNSESEDPAVIASFSLDDTEVLNEVLERAKLRNEGMRGIRFGIQDINRMFGGIVEFGKMIVIGACQHQHKTGFTLALTRHAAMYNIPPVDEWKDDLDVNEVLVNGTHTNANYFTGTTTFPNKPIDPEEEWDGNFYHFDSMDEDDYNKGIVWQDEFGPAIWANYPPEHRAGVEKRSSDKKLKDGLDPNFEWYLDPYTNQYVPVKANGDPFGGRIPKHKPAILRISTEDEIEDNMTKLFIDTYSNVEGEPPIMANFSSDYIRAYLNKHLSRNGWHMHFMRINPSEWTYMNIIQTVLNLEARGFKVHVCVVDYMPMIPTTGCTEGPMGYALRDMYRRIRNHMSSKDILFITPHQLSSAAVQLKRAGTDNFLKEMPDKNYYADSSQISHEVDIEIFIDFTPNNEFLAAQRGKYRSPKVIEGKHQYTLMPMHPVYGLQDDLLGKRLTRNTLGGQIGSDGQERHAFWEFEAV